MMISFFPATKKDVKAIKLGEKILLGKLGKIEDELYEDGVIFQLEKITERLDELEDGSVPEVIKALNFSDMNLFWELKGDDEYRSILNNKGHTIAKGVPIDVAEYIVTVMNSYIEVDKFVTNQEVH